MEHTDPCMRLIENWGDIPYIDYLDDVNDELEEQGAWFADADEMTIIIDWHNDGASPTACADYIIEIRGAE